MQLPMDVVERNLSEALTAFKAGNEAQFLRPDTAPANTDTAND